MKEVKQLCHALRVLKTSIDHPWKQTFADDTWLHSQVNLKQQFHVVLDSAQKLIERSLLLFAQNKKYQHKQDMEKEIDSLHQEIEQYHQQHIQNQKEKHELKRACELDQYEKRELKKELDEFNKYKKHSLEWQSESKLWQTKYENECLVTRELLLYNQKQVQKHHQSTMTETLPLFFDISTQTESFEEQHLHSMSNPPIREKRQRIRSIQKEIDETIFEEQMSQYRQEKEAHQKWIRETMQHYGLSSLHLKQINVDMQWSGQKQKKDAKGVKILKEWCHGQIQDFVNEMKSYFPCES